MIRENMHIHSRYSSNSEMEIEDIAKEMIKNNIYYATITDTVDFEKETIPYILIKLKMRNEEIDRVNEEYKEKLKLFKGIEIISPHLYKSSTEAIKSLQLDMIIGSIKELRNTTTNTRKIAYMYYKEILKMVENNEINVVAHLGYLNNIDIDSYIDNYLLNEIFTVMKENKIVLEINNDVHKLKQKYHFYPEVRVLEIYKNRINKVTLGTDAKTLDEINNNLKNAEYTSKVLGLNPVVFKKRKLEII